MAVFGGVIPKDRKIYGNWQVQSPDGILMFRCDEKKAMWYVNRSLGNIISSDPKVVKLNFKPNGLGNHHKNYGLTEMLNICVVCGTDEFLTRHHVVPHCYRKYFPLEIKSHNFHDVLSVCVDCHDKYERKADDYKSQLSIIYQAPINGELIDNKEIIRARKLANSLINFEKVMPHTRKIEIKNQIKEILGVKKLHKSRLDKLLNLEVKYSNKTHGEIVVSKLDDIKSFMVSWRNHFIENNDCKFLPKDWPVNE
jgi:hypothetical protein